ncbi:hypothetical protein F1C76_21730 [Geodermatophilaceae bacterium NBWT11]|nr:hypothetical protein F1C76_21730 [Geodermatophilaceae bacterium NBWT11]
MTTDQGTASSSKGRRRGGPLRIDRIKIVEAARRLDPQVMTMQAVADELGVDRKALNYHVTDREGLLRLVAADVFESGFSALFTSALARADQRIPEAWQSGLHAWAVAVRDSMVSTGVLAAYYEIDGTTLAVFEPVEMVLQRMLDAGFDLTTAGRGLITITRTAMGLGRDAVLAQQSGEHPQFREVSRVLSRATGDDEYPALRGMAAAGLNSPADATAQFDFEVGLVLDALGRLAP